MRLFFLVIITVGLFSCIGTEQESRRKLIVEDLPFSIAEDEKAYADVVIKAILTNRDIPLVQEFESDETADPERLNMIISMYSSAIGSREWEFLDIYELSKKKDPAKGFDYVWKDLKGSTAMQIYIKPGQKKDDFFIEKLEFRSRIDIMESHAFPGGEIDNFKKISF